MTRFLRWNADEITFLPRRKEREREITGRVIYSVARVLHSEKKDVRNGIFDNNGRGYQLRDYFCNAHAAYP